MKKTISLRILFMLLLSFTVLAALNVSASAASITAQIGSSTINVDEEKPNGEYYSVDVPIEIVENTGGFLYVNMDITFPKSFELTGYTNEGLLQGTVFGSQDMTITGPENYPAPSPCTIVCLRYQDNITDTGKLLTLTFNVPKNTDLGDYVISANVTEANAQGTNTYPDDITSDFTVTPGKVTIEEYPNGTCGNDLTWKLNTKTGILAISGSGEMGNFEPAPLNEYKDYIKTVEIAAGVTSITDGAFSDCPNLTTIKVNDGNEKYVVVDSILFNKDETKLVQYPAGKSDTDYTVPESVTEISSKAFYNCKNLTSITIYDNVETIGENAINSGTIIGRAGSAADRYVEETNKAEGTNKIDFVPLYAVTVRATEGGYVIHNGQKITEELTILAQKNTELTFTAEVNTDNDVPLKLRDWYEIINNECISLTGSDSAQVPNTLMYTVTKDITIEANFIYVGHAYTVRLVAFLGRNPNGYFTVGDSNIPLKRYDEFIEDSSNPTKITAVPNDNYVAAYWVRITQDSCTEVLVDTESTIYAYPLGGSVFYQPVFIENNTTVKLYIDKATREILPPDTEQLKGYTIVKNDDLSTDAVEVYNCTSEQDTDTNNNGLTVFGLGDKELTHEAKPQFASQWKISTQNPDTMWTIEIKNPGETEFSDPVVASYDQVFYFNYMFAAGTQVVIREVPRENVQEPHIHTLASWTETVNSNTITRFTGMYELPDEYRLVNHGIMMSQNYDHLKDLKDNETGTLIVTDSTIVGYVTNNTETATSLFTIAKKLENTNDKWFGRAFLVYEVNEGGNKKTCVKYASEIIPIISVDIIPGTTTGNQDIYGPLYWDETIVLEN